MKFGGMVSNTEIHFFSKFGGVGGYRLAEKYLEPQNTSEIRSFWPLGPATNINVYFFDHHCKGKVFINIFM